MSEPTTDQTLDIQGTINGYRKIAFWKLSAAVVLASFGVILLTAGRGNTEYGAMPFDELDSMALLALVCAAVFVAALALSTYTHISLDFTDRQIVTVEHVAWRETSKRCRALTNFSNIVVRHLCHPGEEGGDTYTGSVGLKPADGKAVLWVKSFPTTQDEVPWTAHEFARKLQEMSGLPVADTAGFENGTHGN